MTDHEKCLELARFYHAVKSKQLNFVQQFCENRACDVNQRIPNDSFFRDFMPEMIGCSLLHVAYMENDINAYRLLLSFGADFTLKNQQGSTVVHQIAESSYKQEDDDLLQGRFKNPFLAASLFAHYEYGLCKNPVNQRGITHLHAACMANSADCVLQFLRHDASSISQTVDMDSAYFPGYTPLHFATRYSELCTLETIGILLKHGADVNAEDKFGTTALDILMEKRAKILKILQDITGDCRQGDLMKALFDNEKIIRFIIDDCRRDDL